MKALLRDWWSDTLSKRLFLLLWATLVLSHLLGFWLVHPGSPGQGKGGDASGIGARWMVPSLPPGMAPGGPPGSNHVPGQPGSGQPSSMGPDSHPFDGGPGGPPMGHPPDASWRGPDDSPPDMPGPPSGGAGPGEPPSLWMDYLARFLVMGLAAWIGARWLTAPLRRLASAAEALGLSLGKGHAQLPLLDEKGGPLEVRQTAHVFNDMARGLHAQFEQRGLMMAAVSHDLRTPLTRLRMRLESLRPDPVAERCITDVKDINAMIDSVLDVMNEERRQEPSQAVDVLAMVQAMADDLQEAGHAVNASGDAATLSVQPIAFKRVLSNLVSNALRYGQEADIRVSLRPSFRPTEVCITVDDKGPGIPADKLEAVFKPFVRLETSRSRETGGVGLGLYIARELALRHGGQLRLLNRPEGGLRAELTLPVRQ